MSDEAAPLPPGRRPLPPERRRPPPEHRRGHRHRFRCRRRHACADYGYLNGRYNSTYGEMYIRADGEDVWMIYRWQGKSRILGVVEGDGRSVYACYTEGEGSEATGFPAPPT